ncbi:MAG: rhodanese-related sulfurtransferase [Pseudomonadota bacterium]
MAYRIAALYQFTRFDDPSGVRAHLLDALGSLELCGTLLVAKEGINGTIASSEPSVEAAIATLRALPGCAEMDVKYATAETAPYRWFKVKLKREIVTMGVPEADPCTCVGAYVAPEDWNDLISDPGTVVVDTRNDYEVGLGSFEGAINPETLSFRDFPTWFKARFSDAPPQRVALFCTGGIRCEKATSFVKQLGIEDVFHLEGGILRYLETVPEAESLWRGECFVFDERVAVGHGLAPGTAILCRACKYPVRADEVSLPGYEAGISCARCVDQTTDAQKARFRERQRQLALARRRAQQSRGTGGEGHADHR